MLRELVWAMFPSFRAVHAKGRVERLAMSLLDLSHLRHASHGVVMFDTCGAKEAFSVAF